MDDPLSEVLQLFKLHHYCAGGFEAGGNWAIAFGEDDNVRFYSVLAGECWLSLEGVSAPMRITTGQSILLPRGHAFRVGSDLSVRPIDAMRVLPNLLPGGIIRLNEGAEFASVGGVFTLCGRYDHELICMLPPAILIDGDASGSVMRGCSEMLRHQLHEDQPGDALMIRQLMAMLLVQTIRLHLSSDVEDGISWLSAFKDQRLTAALRAMHKNPAHRWTLRSLAKCAGMSRTSFAVDFKRVVGRSPMQHLTRWRMMVAGDRLMTSTDTIASIADALGYESESAFCNAFKREMGCAPRTYGKKISPERSYSNPLIRQTAEVNSAGGPHYSAPLD